MYYQEIADRTKEFANFIIENKSTIRACAKHFNISKSTVHYYLKYKLINIDRNLYYELRQVLETNFMEKHLRGGEITRQKYINHHNNKEFNNQI
ncbi:MAG: sporulation transcriptional regulator SpoIIID [Clostridia bacterium]|nr:sporulation transcriptional regulator SpoIIID [Clostridia bacterium]